MASVPMVPPAPGLFSTTTGLPTRFSSRSAMTRATVSGVDAAAKGAIMWIVFAGHSCACVASATAKSGVRYNLKSRVRYDICRFPGKRHRIRARAATHRLSIPGGWCLRLWRARPRFPPPDPSRSTGPSRAPPIWPRGTSRRIAPRPGAFPCRQAGPAESSGVLEWGDVHGLFVGMLMRAHDGAFAGKVEVAARLGLFHEPRNVLRRIARGLGIDAVHAEHERRIERPAGAVALLASGAREARQVAVARAVDEHARANGLPAGLGLDHERGDRLRVAAQGRGAVRMEEDLHARRSEQPVRGALVGRHVVGLGERLAEDHVRLVQAVERGDAIEKLGGDSMHDAAHG